MREKVTYSASPNNTPGYQSYCITSKIMNINLIDSTIYLLTNYYYYYYYYYYYLFIFFGGGGTLTFPIDNIVHCTHENCILLLIFLCPHRYSVVQLLYKSTLANYNELLRALEGVLYV